MTKLQRILMTWLLLIVGSAMLTVSAQDDFNPGNPPEPDLRLRVSVSSERGNTSGSGTYLSGTKVKISTSSQSPDFTFAYWTLNGEKYSEQKQFEYVVADRNVNFVAIYDFTPVNPSEPQTPDTYRVYVSTNEPGSCSFNRDNGAKAKAGEYVTLIAAPSQGYKFKGWFLDGVKQSEQLTFNFYMPASNVNYEARFVYNPDSPDEPQGDGSQTGNITNSQVGDVNGDGTIDTSDAVMIIEHYIKGITDKLNKATADVNGDGKIDTTDAVKVINKYVNNE